MICEIGASAAGHKLCVSYLLQHGADPALVNAMGQTPLDSAKDGGNESIVQLIKSALNTQNSENSSSKRTAE